MNPLSHAVRQAGADAYLGSPQQLALFGDYDLSLEGVRIVVDAAHGAAYKTAPLGFQELGAKVTAIGVKPNGTNIASIASNTLPRAGEMLSQAIRRWA